MYAFYKYYLTDMARQAFCIKLIQINENLSNCFREISYFKGNNYYKESNDDFQPYDFFSRSCPACKFCFVQFLSYQLYFLKKKKKKWVNKNCHPREIKTIRND